MFARCLRPPDVLRCSILVQNTGDGLPPLVAFVSSHMSDQTRWARKTVADVLQQSSQFKPWLFEDAPASSEILVDSYLTKVREAGLVIWLVERETTKPVRDEISARPLRPLGRS